MPVSLGDHIKRLREVRRLTQDDLAQRSGLAADTIRRLEHQDFSPSLRTLRKVCRGLDLSVAVMFSSYELEGLPEEISRVITRLVGRPRRHLQLVERVLGEILDGLDDR